MVWPIKKYIAANEYGASSCRASSCRASSSLVLSHPVYDYKSPYPPFQVILMCNTKPQAILRPNASLVHKLYQDRHLKTIFDFVKHLKVNRNICLLFNHSNIPNHWN